MHRGTVVHADAISESVARAMIDMMIGKLLSVEAETAMKEAGILDTFNNSEVTK